MYGRYNGSPDPGLYATGDFLLRYRDPWNSGGTTYFEAGADVVVVVVRQQQRLELPAVRRQQRKRSSRAGVAARDQHQPGGAKE